MKNAIHFNQIHPIDHTDPDEQYCLENGLYNLYELYGKTGKFRKRFSNEKIEGKTYRILNNTIGTGREAVLVNDEEYKHIVDTQFRLYNGNS